MRDLQMEKRLKGLPNEETGEHKLHIPVNLQKDIEAVAEELAEEEIQKRPAETKLVSLEAYKARLKEEFKETLQMREAGASLSSAIFMIIQQGKNYLDLETFTQVIDEFETAFDHLMKLDSKSWVDKNFKELTGITDETVGNIEKMAIQKHKEKDFNSSARLFFLLTVLCPNNFMYWIRLGINHQELGNYKEALKYYFKAFNLNAIHIPNHLFMAECYVELNDKFNAVNESELLKALIESQDREGQWKEHFNILNKVIKEMP